MQRKFIIEQQGTKQCSTQVIGIVEEKFFFFFLCLRTAEYFLLHEFRINLDALFSTVIVSTQKTNEFFDNR